MGHQYAIEPATLRKAVSGLEAASAELSTQWANLMTTVNGMGAPWGGDDIGMLIGESYLAIQAVANESFTGAAEDMTEFCEKLTTMADNHERAEQEMMTEVSSVSAMLNGG
jgi:hypothetical protein